MKRTLFTLIVVCSTSAIMAQINKGAWMLSANSNLGFNSYSYKSSSSTSLFNINSKAGYFVADNFSLGLNFGYINGSIFGSNSSPISITTVGVFSRYFISKNVFLGAGFNSLSISSSTKSYTTYPFELGFAGFISESFAIEPSINYIIAGGDEGGITTSGIPSSATSSFGLNVAFTFYLNRSKGE